MSTPELLRVGNDQLRVGRWRGNQGVAVLLPAPDSRLPSPRGLDGAAHVLAARGVTQVLTGALSRTEQQPFLDAGFTVHEELHLLAHDLRVMPERSPGVPLSRPRRADRRAALAVDQLAFEPFWRLDDEGLTDAMAATPAHRFRIVRSSAGPGPVAGYAVCGRAADRGYLQRLAVDPAAQRRGLGRALVVDGLRWMRRHGVERAVVNTQIRNVAALRLYRDLGFVDQPEGLAVLARTLDSNQA